MLDSRKKAAREFRAAQPLLSRSSSKEDRHPGIHEPTRPSEKRGEAATRARAPGARRRDSGVCVDPRWQPGARAHDLQASPSSANNANFTALDGAAGRRAHYMPCSCSCEPTTIPRGHRGGIWRGTIVEPARPGGSVTIPFPGRRERLRARACARRRTRCARGKARARAGVSNPEAAHVSADPPATVAVLGERSRDAIKALPPSPSAIPWVLKSVVLRFQSHQAHETRRGCVRRPPHRDLGKARRRLGRKVDRCFGGGKPSLFPPKRSARSLQRPRARSLNPMRRSRWSQSRHVRGAKSPDTYAAGVRGFIASELRPAD